MGLGIRTGLSLARATARDGRGRSRGGYCILISVLVRVHETDLSGRQEA